MRKWMTELRLALGLTIRRASQMAGVSMKVLQALERTNGRVLPSIAVDVAGVYGMGYERMREIAEPLPDTVKCGSVFDHDPLWYEHPQDDAAKETPFTPIVLSARLDYDKFRSLLKSHHKRPTVMARENGRHMNYLNNVLCYAKNGRAMGMDIIQSIAAMYSVAPEAIMAVGE